MCRSARASRDRTSREGLATITHLVVELDHGIRAGFITSDGSVHPFVTEGIR
jgi:hypothetical protein